MPSPQSLLGMPQVNSGLQEVLGQGLLKDGLCQVSRVADLEVATNKTCGIVSPDMVGAQLSKTRTCGCGDAGAG